MVRLFGKKKAPEYNGFAKYNEEYNRYAQSPSMQQAQRAQSLSNASSAALAALQMHSKAPVAQQPKPAPSRPSYRSNSLRAPPRSNSIQSYTYTPRASYVTGPPAHRSYSLRSNSLAGSVRSNNRSSMKLPHEVFPEDEELTQFSNGVDDSMVVTTRTTKVMDSMGRTKSITTETVRSLPDGTNIIETKTTNISISGSRSNSLQGGAAGLTHPANYNLKKIEEDLSDFDYTYLDPDSPKRSRVPEPSINNNQPLTHDHSVSPATKGPTVSPVRNENRTSSITSTQSNRRLKSILKNSSAANAAAAVAAQDSANSAALSSLVKTSDLQSPREPPLSSGSELKQSFTLFPSPNIQSKLRQSSENSIKFVDTVETIPNREGKGALVGDAEDSVKREKEKQTNLDLYNKAIQVATERVYGSPKDIESPTSLQSSPGNDELADFAEKRSEKKVKKDSKRSKLESAGVNKNYVYSNHHRDFTVHSLRDVPKSNDDKKLLKLEQRKQSELSKSEEKQRKRDEKAHKKRERSGFSLFKRNKRREEVDSDDNLSAGMSASSNNADVASSGTQKNSKVVADSSSIEHDSVAIGSGRNSNDVLAQQVNDTDASVHSVHHNTFPVEPLENPETRTLEPAVTEEEDEFVDVPDHLADEGIKRLSKIPVIEQEDHFEAIIDSDPDIENKHSISNSTPHSGEHVQVQSEPKNYIPDTDEAPVPIQNTDTEHDQSLKSEAINNEVVTHIPDTELPTLISKADGTPQVLTASMNNVQPRRYEQTQSNISPDYAAAKSSTSIYTDVNASGFDGTRNAQGEKLDLDNSSYKQLSVPSSGEETNSKPASKDAKILGENTPRSTEISPTRVDENSRVAIPNGNLGSSPEISDSKTDTGHAQINKINNGFTNSQKEPGISHPSSSESVESVPRSKKKGSKFKQVIEKYFINTYSR